MTPLLSNCFLLLVVNSQRGLVHYLKSQFLDKTFKGLYTPQRF